MRALFDEVLANAELAGLGEEALALAAAYLDAGILTPKWAMTRAMLRLRWWPSAP